MADDRDRCTAVFFRETLDDWTISEGVACLPTDLGLDPDAALQILTWAHGLEADLPPGAPGDFEVLTFTDLCRRIVSRCYRHGVPLVGWDLPWQLGPLAMYAGRSLGGSFSIRRAGAGAYKDGRIRDSFYWPRIRIEARCV